MRSTRCPSGIFSAHGIPAQNPSAARNSAERPRYSLTKKVPTMPVRPEIPAAMYTINGGRYESRISRPSSRKLRSIQRQRAPSAPGAAAVEGLDIGLRAILFCGAARAPGVLGDEVLRHGEMIGAVHRHAHVRLVLRGFRARHMKGAGGAGRLLVRSLAVARRVALRGDALYVLHHRRGEADLLRHALRRREGELPQAGSD